MRLLRWGQSAYETRDQLDEERRRLSALGFDVHTYVGDDPPVEGVSVLALTSKVRVDEAVLARSDALRLVVTTTSGHEHIDVAACARRAVVVARCPLARRDAVVDTALAMALSLLRDVPSLHSRARDGVWARAELPERPIRRVRGLPVGLVGHGVIGSRAAQVWRALGADVRVCDPRLKGGATLEEVVACTVVSLHCDLNPTTRSLLSRDVLGAMSPDTVLINTARGGIVNEDALIDALRNRRIAGAALDCHATEPFPEGHPMASFENVILAPHAIAWTNELFRDIGRQTCAQVIELSRGRIPTGVINNAVLDRPGFQAKLSGYPS